MKKLLCIAMIEDQCVGFGDVRLCSSWKEYLDFVKGCDVGYSHSIYAFVCPYPEFSFEYIEECSEDEVYEFIRDLAYTDRHLEYDEDIEQFFKGDIAQQAEQLLHTETVAGSIPAITTNIGNIMFKKSVVANYTVTKEDIIKMISEKIGVDQSELKIDFVQIVDPEDDYDSRCTNYIFDHIDVTHEYK